MTLIQTVLCRDLVLQVSDRRLTTLSGSIFDDNTNKSILWCDTMSIGFTGIAFMDAKQKVPTSRWITEALVGVGMQDVAAGVEQLRLKVQDAVNALPSRCVERRLTITLNGTVLRNGKVAGMSYILSNFELENITLAKAQAEFVSGYLVVDKVVNFQYLPIGAAMPLHIARDCRRGVSSALRAGDIDQAVRMLIVTQRRVAAVNKTVGSDALVVSLPRPANSGQPSILMSSFEKPTFSGTVPTFTFVRPGLFDHHLYGPNTVCGQTAMTGLEMTADPNNLDNQSIKWEIISLPGMST